MSEEILIKGFDPTKANPNFYETYTLNNFSGDFEQYNGRISIRFKHLSNSQRERILIKVDGEDRPSIYKIFELCVKEIHGLVYEINGERKEYTPKDILAYAQQNAITDDGYNVNELFDSIVMQSILAIFGKSQLTEEEIKN